MLLQGENGLVSVREYDIGRAQKLTSRACGSGERQSSLQFPLLTAGVGPVPALTNSPNSFSSD
jgi:hypothetical protein